MRFRDVLVLADENDGALEKCFSFITVVFTEAFSHRFTFADIDARAKRIVRILAGENVYASTLSFLPLEESRE